MFLRKVIHHRRWGQFVEIFTWLAFISSILVISNGVASIDKVRAYNYQLITVLMTYGWIVFFSLLEALAVALGVELFIILVARILKVDLIFWIRLMLLAGLILTLAQMLALIFTL